MNQAARMVLRTLAGIGTVPDQQESFVCPICFGPVTGGFDVCFGCNRLFAAAPNGLRDRVVPLSIAMNPGAWYPRFVRYKHNSPEDHTALTALVAAYLAAHEDHLAGVLGGAFDRIAVVPSTRGRPFADHPLAKVAGRLRSYRHLLAPALEHVAGERGQRQTYTPALFRADRALAAGRRILLLEDLWVSGASAISAAGVLLGAGARAVAVLPIAREVQSNNPYCPEEYAVAAAAPFDVDAWPRG